MNSIPIIDVSSLYNTGKATDSVDMEIGEALHRAGFAVLTNAKVDFGLIGEIQKFFQLGESEKMEYAKNYYKSENTNLYRGYFPADYTANAPKEGYDIGPPDKMQPESGDPFLEENIWPEHLDDWQNAMCKYYAEVETLGFHLLDSIARYLGIDKQWLSSRFEGHRSTLRPIRYPYNESYTHKEICAPHVDSGFLTILYQDTIGGLQAKSPFSENDDGYIDVPAVKNSFAINIGKTAERWSNGYFKATEHRVLNSFKERYSVPFFFEPAFDTVIDVLPSSKINKAPSHSPENYKTIMIENIKNFSEYSGLFGQN